MTALWPRLGRVIPTFAIAGWLAGVVVLATDDEDTFPEHDDGAEWAHRGVLSAMCALLAKDPGQVDGLRQIEDEGTRWAVRDPRVSQIELVADHVGHHRPGVPTDGRAAVGLVTRGSAAPCGRNDGCRFLVMPWYEQATVTDSATWPNP